MSQMISTPQRPMPGMAKHNPSQSTPASITPKEVLGVLRRRMWLIIIITTLFTILGGVLWFVFNRTSPAYTSTGYIECPNPYQSSVFDAVPILPTPGIITQETQSVASIISSDSFLMKALSQREDIKRTKWFKSFGTDVEKRLDDFKDNFRAVPRRDTDLVVVSMTAPSPKEAMDILNAILLEFEQQNSSNAKTDLISDMQTLRDLERNFEVQISVKKDQLKDIRQRFQDPGWETGNSPIMQDLLVLRQDRLRLRSVQEDLNSQLKLIQNYTQQGQYTANVISMVNNEPMILGLKQRLASFEEERESQLERFGEKHDQIKGLDAHIKSIRLQISSKESEFLARYQESESNNYASQLEAVSKSLETTNDDILKMTTQLKNVEKNRQEINELTVDLQDLTNRLNNVKTRINSTDASLRNPVFATIRQLGQEPITASFPKLQIFLPGGFIFGLMLSIGLAFFLEFLDDTIKTPFDVTRHLHVPMLGMIPQYDDEDVDTLQISKIAHHQPNSILGEAVRQSKTNLLFSAPSEELKTILLTGSSADCGTTTTAVNMAISLADKDHRVLLIEANYYRPSFKKIFPSVDMSQGLSDILVGRCDASQAITETDVPNLDVLVCGTKPPNPGVLLNSQNMKEFMSQQQQNYQYIIIDTPPGLVVSDARILGALSDGVIMVLHAKETARGMAQRMIREFKATNVKIFGVMLNAVQPRKGGYFKKSFQTYYDYVGNSDQFQASGTSSDKTLDKN